jgi:hypothetical protein
MPLMLSSILFILLVKMLSINVAVCEVILVGFVIRGINDEVKN